MSEKIVKKKRVYFSENFNPDSWLETEKVLEEMLAEEISSEDGLLRLIKKYSELSDILEEAQAWKTIKMTQHADNPQLAKEQADFYRSVIAPAAPHFFKLEKKIFESEFFAKLTREEYSHLRKILQNGIELFREENVPLFVEENNLSGKYGEIYSSLTVEFEGEEKTLKAMDIILQDKDRSRREKAWRLVAEKMIEKKGDFDSLFDKIKPLRIRIAKNAGFDNYRDYIHKAYGRFDYTPSDIFEFHNSIEEVVVPAFGKINENRREKLGVDRLRPWDMSVDPEGIVLRPFEKTEDLLRGSAGILGKVDLEFSGILLSMSENGLLDLPNRKGKAPGGYNYPLLETGSSFIFMNAVGVHFDVLTLLHEAGHAFHSFYLRDEEISCYKDIPHEIAELASMSMELISSEFMDEFYKNEAEAKKAKREHLERALSTFPAVAVVDAFQHWIYLNPEHSVQERSAEYSMLKSRFGAGVDWSGLEKEEAADWPKVLHIFEYPFYYIEYAISQLGAIAIYKRFKENPKEAIEGYKRFMKLGYRKSVSEIYAAAGIRFDFSKEYLREMTDFVMEELEELE